MKNNIIILLIIAAAELCSSASAQHCTILGFETVKGNSFVNCEYKTHAYPNGSFAIPLFTNATIADVRTDCTPPQGTNIMGVYRVYDNDYTTILEENCMLTGGGIKGSILDIFEQSNGDVVLTGEFAINTGDFGIQRRDASDQVIWSKGYGSPYAEGYKGAERTKDGGYILYGYSLGSGGDVDTHIGGNMTFNAWILKVDSMGDKQWAKVLGTSTGMSATSVMPADDGGVYVFGGASADDFDGTGSKGGSDMYVARLDSMGNKVWHKRYGGSKRDYTIHYNSRHVARDGKGGFYFLGYTESGDGDVQDRDTVNDGMSLWVIHIDSLGNLFWQRTFGGPGNQIPYSLCMGADGTLWAIAENHGNTPGGDIDQVYGFEDGWVVHFDTLGNLINQRTLGTNHREEAWLLHPLPDGTVLVGGIYMLSGSNLPAPAGTPGFPNDHHLIYHYTYLAHLSPETDLGIDTPGVNPLFGWEVYPNPAGDMLNLRLPELPSSGKMMAIVTDMQGRRVYAVPVTARDTSVPTRSWASGNYLVTLMLDDKTVGVKKISINH